MSEQQNELFATGRGDPPIVSEALFSPCERYRYTLDRAWSDSPRILFVLLNPSHATEVRNDQTVSNCIQHARRWGFGWITVCNLFAYRSPYPAEMKAQEDPVGPDNDRWIVERHSRADTTVIGWGNGGMFRDRDLEVLKLLTGRLMCFDRNKAFGIRPEGTPKHPCYLHGCNELPMRVWRPE